MQEKNLSTVQMGKVVLDRNLIKFALGCVDTTLAKARHAIGKESYEQGDLGGDLCIAKEDINQLFAYILSSNSYSTLEQNMWRTSPSETSRTRPHVQEAPQPK